MRDNKFSMSFESRESSHYIDRAKLPSIYGWIAVAILLFFLPLVLSNATIDAIDQHTLAQLASLKLGHAYPPNDPHMWIDTEIAAGCNLSFGCSMLALVMAVREFISALTPRV